LRIKWERDGYLVLHDFVPESSIDTLKQQIYNIIESTDRSNMTYMFLGDQQNDTGDYFLDSSDKICLFLEPKLDSVPSIKFSDSLNKIGHALFDLDPVFGEFGRDQRFEQIARITGQNNPVVCQSMYIFKPPFIGSEVPPHQDSAFFENKPKFLYCVLVPC